MLIPKKHRTKKGQAIVELLPSLTLFVMVMSVGLAYFRVMREAAIRQEIVRNLAFAKINNSGTLTTTQIQVARGGVSLIEAGAVQPAIMNVDGTAFVDSNKSCFWVSPGDSIETVSNIAGAMVGPLAPVNILTYAVIYRKPGSSCAP